MLKKGDSASHSFRPNGDSWARAESLKGLEGRRGSLCKWSVELIDRAERFPEFASNFRCCLSQGIEDVVFVCGLFVDWLFYFVFATWFALRVVGTYTRNGRAMSQREIVGLGALPLVGALMADKYPD